MAQDISIFLVVHGRIQERRVHIMVLNTPARRCYYCPHGSSSRNCTSVYLAVVCVYVFLYLYARVYLYGIFK